LSNLHPMSYTQISANVMMLITLIALLLPVSARIGREQEHPRTGNGVAPTLDPDGKVSMLEIVSELHFRDETTPEIKLELFQQNAQLLSPSDADVRGNSSKSFQDSPSMPKAEDAKQGLSLQQQKHQAPFGAPEISEIPTTEQWLQQKWNYYWSCLNIVFLIKAGCMMSNVVFQLSPYPTIKRIRSEKDTGDFDAAPLVSIAFGCVQWSFYGTFAWLVTGKNGFLIVVYANCFGAFVGIFYVLSYQTYCQCQKARSKLHKYLQMVRNLMIIEAIAIFAFPVERALLFCGAVASSSTIFSAFAPWTAVPAAISTKNSEKMPLTLLGASLVSSSLWLVCGLLLWDVWIMVPNCVGVLSNILLVGIAAKYHNVNTKQLALEGKAKECKYDCHATLDEKLPLWQAESTSQQESSGSSGGTF